MLLHLHPPKTGGKTIETYLQLLLGDELARVSRIFPDIANGDVADYAGAFRREPAKKPLNAKVVTGHFCFGLHDALGVEPAYMSVIRDPADRLKSYYNYILNSKPYFVQKFILQNDISFEKLARFGDGFFVENYPAELDIMVENGQARLLAGETGTLAEPFDERRFAIALENVRRHYVYLAPTERVTDALIAACLHLGMRPPLRYRPVNVGTVDHVGTIDPALKDYILARNRFDVALYDHAGISFADYLTKRGLAAKVVRYKSLIEFTGGAYALAKKLRI